MHNRIVGIAVLIVTSCAPRVTQSATAFDPQAANALAYKNMLQAEDTSRAMLLAQQARINQEMADKVKQGEDQKRAEEAARAERTAKLFAVCEETRPSRIKHALALIPAHQSEDKQSAETTRKIRAVCRLITTATGAMNVERSGHTTRLVPEMKSGIKCDGRPPSGLTEEQALDYLRWAEGGSITEFNIGEEGPWAKANLGCLHADKSVGLFMMVSGNDTDGVQKVIAWQPPSDASIPLAPPPAQ